MERRSFFKNLGFGLGAAVLTPQLLFSNEELVSSTDIPKYAGKYGSTFKIKFDKVYEVGDILTTDPEYGQQLMVVATKENTHEVKLVTIDKEEYFLEENLKKGTEFFRLSHDPLGEYTTHVCGGMTDEEVKNITAKII